MQRLKIVLFAALSFAFILAAVGFAGSSVFEKCPLCGMNIEGNENTAYEIAFTDGKTATYCCAHCGLWVHASEKDKVKSARARDFISGEWKDPSKMVFLFKSKAVPACAPSWISFASKSDAENFKKGFGGEILPFKKALEERLKHPKGMEM